MAASIGGYTIHHWSGIPTAQTEGRAGTKDTSALSIKCQCLRFILIDEISMVSAELVSVLEHVVQIVVKSRTLWKKRADGSKRVFGGINMLLFGDWWQLKPVAGTPLFQSPFGPAGNVQKTLGMFWGEGRDAIHHTWELTELVRCKDRWYNLFLMGCRDGNLSCGHYIFLNGFATRTPGSFVYGGKPATSCLSDKCCKHLEEDPLLGWYRRDWKAKIFTRLLRRGIGEVGWRRRRLRTVQESTSGQNSRASARDDTPKRVFRGTFCSRASDLQLQRAAVLHHLASSTGIRQASEATVNLVPRSRCTALQRGP